MLLEVVMNNSQTTIFDNHSKKEVVITWEGEDVASILLWGQKVTSSYLPEGKVVIAADLPSEWGQVIYPYSRKEVEELLLTGGKIRIFADDLLSMEVTPSWWGVEHQMATEVTPPWPLAEDAIGGEEIGFPILALMAIFSPPPEEEEDDEGGDFV
jgi:hypothetical protein